MLSFMSLPRAASLVHWLPWGASLLAVLALMFALVLLELRWRKLTASLEGLRGEVSQLRVPPPEIAAALDGVNAARAEQQAIDGALKTLAARVDGLGNQLTRVVEVLTNAHQRECAAAVQDDSRQRANLLQVYQSARQRYRVFAAPLNELNSPVSQLGRSCAIPELAQVAGMLMEQHTARSSLGSDLASKIQELSREPADPAPETESLLQQLRAGSMNAGDCLHQALAVPVAPLRKWPDVAEEQARLAKLTDNLPDDFLAWLDGVTELRVLANESGQQHLVNACTRVIESAALAAKNWQIEIEDVMVGVCRFDERQHELVQTVPRADVKPETIIGVSRLGYRRNGTLVRKPQVIVAAAIY